MSVDICAVQTPPVYRAAVSSVTMLYLFLYIHTMNLMYTPDARSTHHYAMVYMRYQHLGILAGHPAIHSNMLAFLRDTFSSTAICRHLRVPQVRVPVQCDTSTSACTRM